MLMDRFRRTEYFVGREARGRVCRCPVETSNYHARQMEVLLDVAVHRRHLTAEASGIKPADASDHLGGASFKWSGKDFLGASRPEVDLGARCL
jgi:hypothetical protein